MGTSLSTKRPHHSSRDIQAQMNHSYAQLVLDIQEFGKMIQHEVEGGSKVFTSPPKIEKTERTISIKIPLKIGAITIEGSRYGRNIDFSVHAMDGHGADNLTFTYGFQDPYIHNHLFDIYEEIKGNRKNKTPWNADNAMQFWRFLDVMEEIAIAIRNSYHTSMPTFAKIL